ncbi:MAG: PleD family two-component system response regulator [Methylobacteriaceae bacterium]|jgi:two-component system chemotaxis response regulator CheY|uniref:Chemotaxis response regulator receiver n=4 Tax=Methylorubrum extorquens TaxID=408 RepID=C5AZF1_METEA|nr:MULTISPECIES: response regulator [Methylobacteriaceae]KQO85138.1 two-component system response regulator [Methylobacterium sp. Leaf90]KQO87704.1 two-component system response regulator [Methylobacterium sp. Leaf92]MDF9866202.1 two-component system chemotaxis response regulator CheY [Methylorubrum pseudosasae]MDH6639748.1 two-component system chemotaxis response regulator CheY [Methylobacterium sp. SuP10 SLI 274]MDH6668942.1 two-component system chemotaxis response regulator CheY [Methylorub
MTGPIKNSTKNVAKTALIVDDSAVIRKVARRILETLDFSVRDAEDGATALVMCAEAMPTVILLDWNMPNMDGYEVLRLLRQSPLGDQPKVLFCTTENDVGAIARALHAGADEYIMKPFDREIMMAKLDLVGFAVHPSEAA